MPGDGLDILRFSYFLTGNYTSSHLQVPRKKGRVLGKCEAIAGTRRKLYAVYRKGGHKCYALIGHRYSIKLYRN